MGMNDINSLSHTKWNCKYHIVFAPKYRRKVFYKEKREAVGKILRQLCEWKGVKIIEAEACPDHIHRHPTLLHHPIHKSLFGFPCSSWGAWKQLGTHWRAYCQS